jgi:hypothetical protein
MGHFSTTLGDKFLPRKAFEPLLIHGRPGSNFEATVLKTVALDGSALSARWDFPAHIWNATNERFA